MKRTNQCVLNLIYRDMMAYFKISLDETGARDWCPGSLEILDLSLKFKLIYREQILTFKIQDSFVILYRDREIILCFMDRGGVFCCLTIDGCILSRVPLENLSRCHVVIVVKGSSLSKEGSLSCDLWCRFISIQCFYSPFSILKTTKRKRKDILL